MGKKNHIDKKKKLIINGYLLLVFHDVISRNLRNHLFFIPVPAQSRSQINRFVLTLVFIRYVQFPC
jgi:hypothetical protein